MLGIGLVDKPLGLSSHDAIYRVRRALGIRKIGHAGTLDPNATGLLVMAVGQATRFLPYLVTDPKTYTGVARLGVSTSTQDSEGEILQERPVNVELSQIEAAAAKFVGSILQLPPMYSAIQVNGIRLYKLARQGVEVDREARQVTIQEFVVSGLAGDELSFTVTCSAGTYIRTLVNDLGEALGCGAHLMSLRRTRSGHFSVKDASPPEELTPAKLLTLEDALAPLPMVRLPEPIANAARHGNEFPLSGEVQGDTLGLLGEEGLFAIARRLPSGMWGPERVLPPK